MTKETMSVHKALAELKVLNSRIQKSIGECQYVLVAKKSSTKIGGIEIDSLKTEIEDKYKSIRDLCARSNAIKAAVVQSNAVTKISVCGKEYTVAAAIDMKDRGMAHLQMLLNTMSNAYKTATMQADRENSDLEQRAEKFITGSYASTDMKGAAAEVEEARLRFIENQTVGVIDPLDVSKEIKALEETITSFATEVDAALSVSNAITQIEIEY